MPRRSFESLSGPSIQEIEMSQRTGSTVFIGKSCLDWRLPPRLPVKINRFGMGTGPGLMMMAVTVLDRERDLDEVQFISYDYNPVTGAGTFEETLSAASAA
jgi:hypothetical protein